MGVLEKFLILFESDADDANKDVKKLDNSLDDVEQSSRAATDAANSFSEGTKNLSSSAKLAAADLANLSKEDVVKSKQIDNLNSLSKDLKKLGETEALEVGKKIGLDERQIKTLRKGKEGVRELSKELKGIKTPASSASKQFVSLGTKALGAVGGIVAITSAITGFISTAGRIDELGKFADLIGENLEDIDAWGGAVVRAGGSADGFRGSIKSLNEKMVDASVKGFNEITPFFNQLGISIVDVNGKVKSTIDILPELASSFERIGKQKALGIGQKLGLDSGTIALLQQGGDAVDKLIERQKKLGLVNEEASKISAEFNDIMADFKQISGFTAQSLLVSFIPAVTWTIDKLIDLSMWARENKPIMIGFFVGVAAVAIPVLFSLASAGWAAIAPFLVMAAPFIAVAAAAGLVGTAIALVIEDIAAFLNGHDSLLGKMIEKWPILGDVVQFIIDDIKAFIEMIKSLWGVMTSFGEFLIDVFMAPEKAIQSLMNSLDFLRDAIAGFTGEAFEKLSSVAEGMKSFFSFGDDDEEEDDKKSLGSKVKSFFSFGDDDEENEINKNIMIGQDPIVDEINKNIAIGQGSIALAASHPLASQTSNSIQNNNKSLSRSTSVQTGDIIVQTQATDSQGIAAGVGGSLKEEMRTTVENFDDGIEI